jgi:hypothetical protein
MGAAGWGGTRKVLPIREPCGLKGGVYPTYRDVDWWTKELPWRSGPLSPDGLGVRLPDKRFIGYFGQTMPVISAKQCWVRVLLLNDSPFRSVRGVGQPIQKYTGHVSVSNTFHTMWPWAVERAPWCCFGHTCPNWGYRKECFLSCVMAVWPRAAPPFSNCTSEAIVKVKG